jgi:hypothetical protein
MAAALLPDEVHAAISARVETLSPTDGYSSDSANGYGHGANDAWRESDRPLVPELAPKNAAHLSFFVDDRSIEDLETRQDVDDDEPEVASTIVVRFLFELRPNCETRDWKASGRAGVHVLRHLLKEGWDSGFVVRPDRQLMQRSFVGSDAGGTWVRVDLRLRVLYILSLASQP